MDDPNLDHRECLHDQPNAATYCPACGVLQFIVRPVEHLLHDEVYGYDPICGYTLKINVT